MEVKVYAQFQPSKAFEVLAVVPQKRNVPVKSVEIAKVPFLNPCVSRSQTRNGTDCNRNIAHLPMYGRSTIHPARIAPGRPMTDNITRLLRQRIVSYARFPF